MDLPDFIKESVPQIQILCTIQARNVVKTHMARRTDGISPPGEKPVLSQAYLLVHALTARGARKRAVLANATLNFVESVAVLLTVVQGKDGTQKCWLKNLNPEIASDLLGILGNSASSNRGVADGNHGGT